jgi:hypothetical protein
MCSDHFRTMSLWHPERRRVCLPVLIELLVAGLAPPIHNLNRVLHASFGLRSRSRTPCHIELLRHSLLVLRGLPRASLCLWLLLLLLLLLLGRS